MITSSIVPFMKNARSGKSSYLPSRISLKPRTVSAIGTYEPGVPVNCSATVSYTHLDVYKRQTLKKWLPVC